MKTHRLTWRNYCPVYVDAETREQAIAIAIAWKPNHIPPGTALFYGLAGGLGGPGGNPNAGAVYIVPEVTRAEAILLAAQEQGMRFRDIKLPCLDPKDIKGIPAPEGKEQLC